MSKIPGAQTYQSLIRDATHQLENYSESPRVDSEILLQHAISRTMAWLVAHGDKIAIPVHIRDFFILLERRKLGQPIAYILGYRDFWTLRLKVNAHVLIPRPDTETLVEQVLELIDPSVPCRLLDLGTGSGAIALSIAKERPLAKVLAVDSQMYALEIAKQNAQQHELNNVDFLQSNWFDDLPTSGFDLIASNPPYVEASDKHLLQGDLRFEPDSALIGGADGLADLREIISTAPEYLTKGGWLVLEHGVDQHTKIEALLVETGFRNIDLHRDLNNHPRCSVGQWPG